MKHIPDEFNDIVNENFWDLIMDMVKYKKIYIDFFGYTIADFIPCEVCMSKSIDIHHIKFKSQGGKDEIDNLIALCRECHEIAHSSTEFNENLKDIHSIEIDIRNNQIK